MSILVQSGIVFSPSSAFAAAAGVPMAGQGAMPLDSRLIRDMDIAEDVPVSSVLISDGTSVPSQIVQPGITPSIFLDPFADPERFAKRPEGSPTEDDVPSMLRELERSLNEARGDPPDSSRQYRRALQILETQFQGASATTHPFHDIIPDGDLLYSEAVLGTARGADVEETQPLLARLSKAETRLRALEQSEVVRTKIAQTMIMHSHLQVRFASHMPEQQIGFLDRAQNRLSDALDEFDSDDELDREVRFFGDLLSLEILARRIEAEHARGERRKRYQSIQQLVARTAHIGEDYKESTPHNREMVAAYQADAALLLARMQIWGRALDIARGIATKYADTAASRAVLSSETFLPFVESDEGRILSPREIKQRSLLPGWLKKIQAALCTAHAESLTQSAKVGVIGMGVGLAAENILTGGASVYGGAAGAAAFSIASRLLNGLRTHEAKSAGETGIFVREGTDTALDVGRIIMGGASDMAFFGAVPASLLLVSQEGAAIAGEVLGNAYDLYGPRLGSWIVRGATSLVEAETYTDFFGSIGEGISGDSLGLVGAALHNSYLAATAALFLSNLFVPKSRQFAKRVAPFFIPGALQLSAELGLMIQGGEYWNRVGRAAIVFAEISGVMFTWGLISVARRESFVRGVRSIVRGLQTTNYMLPISAAIIQGISSALGGYMQKAGRPESISLLAIQAAATTVGLLPLTLAISGVLKGKVPIVERIREGYQDSRGESVPRRAYEMARSLASSFNMPYAHNRILRAPYWDLTASVPRTMAGWDTNLGQFAMSGINEVSGNHATAMMWTETGGSLWERDRIVAAAQEGTRAVEKARLTADTDKARDYLETAVALQRDFFSKGAQNMHPFHPWLPLSIRDRLFPFHAITRAAWLPKFPLRPNGFTYASLHQMLMGRSDESMSAEQVGMMLEYVKADANDPEQYATLRPLVMTLAMARDSEVHGNAISEFFDENPWLAEFFDLNLDELVIEDGRYRRMVRKVIRRRVRMPFGDYEANVRSYTSRTKSKKDGNGLTQGLFI